MTVDIDDLERIQLPLADRFLILQFLLKFPNHSVLVLLRGLSYKG